MRYNNGFQTISVNRGFIKDMLLYDEDLFVWQDMDGSYYISYNKDRYGPEHARRHIIRKCEYEDGSVREPDNRDLHWIMRNDKRFTTMDEIFSRINEGREKREKEKRENIENRYREELHGYFLAKKRQPSKYSF